MSLKDKEMILIASDAVQVNIQVLATLYHFSLLFLLLHVAKFCLSHHLCECWPVFRCSAANLVMSFVLRIKRNKESKHNIESNVMCK